MMHTRRTLQPSQSKPTPSKKSKAKAKPTPPKKANAKSTRVNTAMTKTTKEPEKAGRIPDDDIFFQSFWRSVQVQGCPWHGEGP
jgi:outer membrane biosynthesis protein TonB